MRSRRLAAASAIALAALLAGCGGGGGGSASIETFRNPTVVSSAGGELRTKLTAASATYVLDERTVSSIVWNGSYTPPVFKLNPGDTLFLELENQSSESTNIHYHGLNVSPRINADATVSDNIFVTVDVCLCLCFLGIAFGRLMLSMR